MIKTILITKVRFWPDVDIAMMIQSTYNWVAEGI